MSGFLGKDGFAWFFGVVEDRMDPLEIGRVKVRIFGYHSEDKKGLPTKALPWATILQSPSNSCNSGKGTTPVGIVEGTWVVGFFTDPNSYQVPIILGSISGLNADTIKTLGENYGTGFQDSRSEEDLKNYPVDEITRSYPNGKGVSGDKHGAQLENAPASKKYPRKKYSSKSSKRKQGTPDTNILAINDTVRLKDTVVGLKTKSRADGGLLDTNVPIADIFFPKFITGVIGLTGVNLGTNKGLGMPPNFVISSSSSSTKNTSNQYKRKPTNTNTEKIHTDPVRAALQTKSKSFKPVLNNGTNMMNSIKNFYKGSLGTGLGASGLGGLTGLASPLTPPSGLGGVL